MSTKNTIIGLTGKFCSGKTMAAFLFEEKGAIRIDVDGVGHDILKNKKNKDKICSVFGKKVFDGDEINRNALRKIVFTNADDLKELNSIVYPEIRAKVHELIKKFDGEVIIIDAALLFQLGLDKISDHIIMVTSPREISVERAVGRGFKEAEANGILDIQGNLCAEHDADFIIKNTGSIDELKKGVDLTWKKIQNLQKA